MDTKEIIPSDEIIDVEVSDNEALQSGVDGRNICPHSDTEQECDKFITENGEVVSKIIFLNHNQITRLEAENTAAPWYTIISPNNPTALVQARVYNKSEKGRAFPKECSDCIRDTVTATNLIQELSKNGMPKPLYYKKP